MRSALSAGADETARPRRPGGSSAQRSWGWWCLAGYAALAALVNIGGTARLDRAATLRLVRAAPCPAFALSRLASPLLSAELAILLGVALLVRAFLLGDRPLLASTLRVLAGVAVATVIELGSKHAIRQPQPRAVLGEQMARTDCPGRPYPLFTLTTAHAFPSGSAVRLGYAAGLVVAGADLAATTGRLAAASAVLLAAAGASTRVLLKWHFPSDVVGGLLLGFGGGCLAAGGHPRASPGAQGSYRS